LRQQALGDVARKPGQQPGGRDQCQRADGREIHTPPEAVTDERSERHAQGDRDASAASNNCQGCAAVRRLDEGARQGIGVWNIEAGGDGE
jgi:hypothetical protein